MIVEFNLTQLIFLAIALFSGGWALFKVLATLFLRDQKKQLDNIKSIDLVQHTLLNDRFDALNTTLKAETAQWQRVERELLNLKADLPLHYVRREDYVQAIATIMTKLDAMALRFENILLKGQIREP